MMKTWLFNLAILWLLGVSAAAQDVSKIRTERDRLIEKGHWKEALTLYEEKLMAATDEKAGSDWTATTRCLAELNEWGRFDELLEQVVTSHAENPHLLAAAAESVHSAPHRGRLLVGAFERRAEYFPPFGRSSNDSGTANAGEMIDCSYRDRVYSVQLLKRAIDLTDDEKEKAYRWGLLASRLIETEGWKLQTLTPLEPLPGWDETGPSGGTEGAPWRDGSPVLYEAPDSWESAKNDGERWRFALEEQVRLNPELRASATMARADFSRSQFSDHYRPMLDVTEGDSPSMALLEDDECMTQTSAGIKRFKLPENHHFIALYHSALAQGEARAGDQLAQVYLARNHRDRAVEVLREVISKHEEGANDSRRKLLQQITGAWGRLEETKTVTVGTRPKMPLVFRNAKSIRLTAARVDIDAVLQDMKDHVSSKPSELQQEKIQLSQLSRRLAEGKGDVYLGEVAASWEQQLQPAEKYQDTIVDVEVPLDKAGAWWVQGTMADGNTVCTLVWIIDTVIVQYPVADQLQIWVVDAATGVVAPNVELEFFGYTVKMIEEERRRSEVVTRSITRTSDREGKVLLKNSELASPHYEWLAIARKDGQMVAFLEMGRGAYQWRYESSTRDISYGVTDRPLYRAGDKIHVKFWTRQVSYGDDVENDRWAGKTCTATFMDGRGQEILKIENLKTDSLGAVEVEAVIPKNAVLGRWQVSISISGKVRTYVGFRVEEYRKPEYEVKVDAPEEPIRLGETFKVGVEASYFHGAPVRNATVEVTVRREAMGERWIPPWRWDWLYGKGAWWNGVEASWHPGWKIWGCFRPTMPTRWTPSEIVLQQTLPIGPDGKVTAEIDTAQAKAIHGDMDARYVVEAKVVDASRREEKGKGEVVAARKPFELRVTTNRGYARPGDEVEISVYAATLLGKQVESASGSLRLLRLGTGENNEITETEVSVWQVTTDADGMVRQRFQAPSVGQYRIAAKLSVNGGEAVEAGVIFNVHGPERADSEWHFGNLELVPDKASYAPDDVVRLRVNSDHENAQVWLFMRVGESRAEVRRIVLDGRSGEVEIQLSRNDMPNMFIEGVTVHGAEVHTAVRQIILPPESRVLDVAVEPAKGKVKPGEESSLGIVVRDSDGNPFQGTATVTIYDKALEAITGGSNIRPIRDSFWLWKRHYRRMSERDSVPRSPEGLFPEGSEGMTDLGAVFGFRVRSFGRAMGMKAGANMVRNNLVENEVAAFAASASFDAIGPAPAAETQVQVRKDFADLLKWAGEVKTDAEGRAEIPLKFPDNLTTWKARVWALGDGTRVGEGSAEIITSKELLVRLQTPRFLVEKDEAVFSAIVHNEHENALTVKVMMEFEGGAVEKLAGDERTVEVASKGEARLDWRVKATKEGEALVRVKAVAQGDGDALEKTVPVVVHGILRQEAWSRSVEPGSDSTTIELSVPEQRRADQTKLTVQFSPTLAGAIVDAIPYLVDYPHGCTEQTLNRFVPVVVAHRTLENLGLDLEAIREKRNNLNAQELGDPKERASQWKNWRRHPVFDPVEIERMEKAGIDRLLTMQNGDGGWGWFSGYREASYPHTTAIVVHGLLLAKANGSEVPTGMLDRGIAWLEAHEKSELAALQRHAERVAAKKAARKIKPSGKPEKANPDATDAFVRLVLGEAGKNAPEMLTFLHKARLGLPVYARCLVALELHRKNEARRRDEVMGTIAQFLKRDDENQTNYLDLKNNGFWWFWYGSETEANAWYLKLLSAVKPNAAETKGLVKYLVNNRRHGAYWNSTRDTAFAIEAIASYLKASGELAPDMEVEVLLDGKSLRQVKLDKDNLFSFDGTVIVEGADLAAGSHTVELRRKGEGTLYANAYLEVFSLENFLRKAGLEVKVERHVYRLIREENETDVPDSNGLVVSQRTEKFRREPLKDGDTLASGDLVEVELILESKNDYEYLVFSDGKAAGLEPSNVLSGYLGGRLRAYMEPKDKSVNFFIQWLPRGTHQLRYQLRAEAPGKYHALPAVAEGMYAPELRANSDEIRLNITEKN